MTLEAVVDDCLLMMATDQRPTSRWQLVRERFEDPTLIRNQLRLDVIAEARAQIRRNEALAKRRRRHVSFQGNNRPSTLVASTYSQPVSAGSLEDATEYLLDAYHARYKKRDQPARPWLADQLLTSVDRRNALVSEIEVLMERAPWRRKTSSRIGRSVKKTMR